MGAFGARGRAIAAATAATLLALASVFLAYSAWLGRENPEAALRLGLHTPEALSAVADRRLAGDARPANVLEAKADAAAALASAPLDVRAVRILALAAEEAGDVTRTETLMRLADARSRRDALTELWLFEDDALGRDFASAGRHADAALRINWRLNNVLFPAMTAALVNPAAVGPIAQRLSERPDWRSPFLSFVSYRADDPAVAARLFRALAAGPAPPTDAESTAIVQRIAVTGDLAGARALWVRLLPKGARAPPSGVYNGDFASAPGAAPFNWGYPAANGAVADPGPATDGKPSLYVRSPAESPHLLAVELLMLPPGAWQLTGMVRVEPGQAGPLFAWRVTCLNGGELADVRIAADPPGWRGFSGDFQSPPGCVAQRLQLFGLPHPGFEPAEAYWRGLAVRPITSPGVASGASGPGAAASASAD